MPWSNRNICEMTATVTSTTPGNHTWTGTGPVNTQNNVYITLADTAGLAVYGTPAAVAVSSGDGQAVILGESFETLSAKVTDANGLAVPGVEVSFFAPSSGASVTQNSSTATTDASGLASISLTANQTVGSYTVVGVVDGVGPRAVFSLENRELAVAAATVTATVAANSSDNLITLNLSGGAANAVAVAGAPSHGVATASGTAITYTPTAGYSGVDSFTYTATNTAGTSAPATVNLTVTPATLQLAPASLPNGTTGTVYASQVLSAAGGTAPHSFTVSTGALPDGLNLATTGALSGTPAAHGSSTFTVTATDALGAVGSWDYVLVIDEQAVTSGAVSSTVAANSSNTTIALNLSGGAASSVAVATAASHGTATASGAAIAYTPTAGYSGADSFTYTATNSAGTSAPATVTVTVMAPTLLLSPAGLPDGQVGTAYAQSITASGGTAPYSYAVTSGALPSGLDLGTGGTLSGTPSAHGAFSITVTATDGLGAIGAGTYTLVIAEQAVTANAAAATVAANSANNPITLNLSGGAANAVAVATSASHGTATATGTAITYTPTAGYSGPDSFSYTASNSVGTSTAATVTVTVTAPALLLSPQNLPDGRVGTAYSQTITASGGTAPYSYAVTSGPLPVGLDLGTDGTLSGKPSAAGSYPITVTATDSLGATGVLTNTVMIEREPNILVFSPVAGALPDAMAGEDYAAPIVATGGVAPMVYGIASGAMPAGMVLNISTGELTGPLKSGTQGRYTFAIQATDGNGDTGTTSYTLAVTEREVTVSDKQVTVAPGASPTNVSLAAGATGGPFTAADIVSVEPANAGTARVVMGEFAQAGGGAPVSFYLKFTPNPAYSGWVTVRFTLTSLLGTSNAGVVTYILGHDPIAAAQQVQSVAQGFVQTRQNLVAATVQLPGLLERRMMAAASAPASGGLSPSNDGLVLNFATSLAEMNAAANAAAGIIDVGELPFNLWASGTINVHNRTANGNRWGSFGMVSAGMDYLLNDKALVGWSFHYDHMIDPANAGGLLTGSGWLTGPYASIELGEGVFWDGSLLYGGSSNTIDTAFWDGRFDTTRWLLDSAITGQWKLDEVTTLTPTLRAVYLNETVQSYTVMNGAGDEIVLDGFTTEQLRVSLSAEIARQFVLDDGASLTPKLGVTGGLSGLDGFRVFGSMSTGLSWQSPGALSIDSGLLFNIDSGGAISAGARLGISGQF